MARTLPKGAEAASCLGLGGTLGGTRLLPPVAGRGSSAAPVVAVVDAAGVASALVGFSLVKVPCLPMEASGGWAASPTTATASVAGAAPVLGGDRGAAAVLQMTSSERRLYDGFCKDKWRRPSITNASIGSLLFRTIAFQFFGSTFSK